MPKQDSLSSYFSIDSLSAKFFKENLFFVLFIGFILVLYIANAHLAERNVREIQLLRNELKEMRWYYMSLQAENMYNAKRSEVAERVKDTGLRVHTDKMNRIQVPKGAYSIQEE
jgi:hypothetical protein